jgi:hypothetical protein
MLRMLLQTRAERILPKDSWRVHYNLRIMPRFFSNSLRALRERRGTDMAFLCRHLLSERGEASQTALAQEIINAYRVMNATNQYMKLMAGRTCTGVWKPTGADLLSSTQP